MPGYMYETPGDPFHPPTDSRVKLGNVPVAVTRTSSPGVGPCATQNTRLPYCKQHLCEETPNAVQLLINDS
jgi:hypothetical protein